LGGGGWGVEVAKEVVCVGGGDGGRTNFTSSECDFVG